MEGRRTTLERGLAGAFGLVVLVVLAFLPISYFAMKGLTDQAQVLRDTVIRGQLAYAKVAADADSLRAATLEAATNPDAAKAAGQQTLAKALVKQFPDDARKMLQFSARRSIKTATPIARSVRMKSENSSATSAPAPARTISRRSRP